MLRLEIVTPEKRIIDADVDAVTVPTASGEVGILPAHAPLVSALKPGVLAYSMKGSNERLAVSGGFVEVNNDRVAVLVDSAESADEIDASRARAERETAEKALASGGPITAEEAELSREGVELADARLTVAAR